MRKINTLISGGLAMLLLFVACGKQPDAVVSEPVAAQEPASSTAIVQEQPQEPEAYVSPVDFAALQAQNSEIYAWLRIPGTTVDYPILQSMESDEFYLRRNIDRQNDLAGSLFTQVTYNSQTFDDPNTVIYGHNMIGYGDTMFSDVRGYDNADYFNEHRDIYIYTPEKEFHYKAFAAYRWTDEHLLYTYNCRAPEVFQSYLDMVQKNKDLSAVIDTEISLSPNNRIITLSTCESNESQERFLLQAVLQ